MDPTAAPTAPPPALAPLGLAPHDLSPWALFLEADPVVKAVMLVLLLASIACWTVVIEKLATLRRLRREARALGEAAAGERLPTSPPDRQDLLAAALRSGIPEWRRGQGARETDGEYRSRLDSAMRRSVARTVLRRGEPGLRLLATTGSVAPFVGLFGTVWGIMDSFSGIAASNDTSLSVVAPGIAEALFATAIGLVAAIPAVIAFNRLSAALGALRQDALAAATELAHRLARSAAEAHPGVAEARPAQRLRPAE